MAEATARDTGGHAGAWVRSTRIRGGVIAAIRDVRIAPWLGVFALGLLVLALRRPESLLNAEFTFEDGREWYQGALRHGPGSFFTVYAGYLHLIPRVVGLLESLVPVQQAPLVGNAIALVLTAGVAAFIASDRLAAVPERSLRIAMAAFVLVVPLADMSLGSITFVQFWLAIFMIAALFSSGGRAVRLGLLVAGLSGAFGLVLMPLYMGRVWMRRDRESVLLAASLGVGAVIELMIVMTHGRPGGAASSDPVTIVRTLAAHLDSMVFGHRWMMVVEARHVPLELGVVVTGVVVLLLALMMRRLPREAVLGLGGAAVLIAGAAVLAGTDDAAHLLSPASASRYFLVPAACLGALTILGIHRRDRAALVLGGLLMIGVVSDLRLPPNTPFGWSETSACIRGPAPCVVPVYPGGQWDIHWPGTSP